MLSKESAFNVRSKLILKNSSKRIDSGNIDYPYDLPILHKMSQELHSSLDLDKNDFMCLYKLREYLKKVQPSVDDPSPNYIRHLHQSDTGISVDWYTAEQAKMLQEQPKPAEVYFDVTGSIVRNQESEKRILYYALVLTDSKSGCTSPIFESMGTNHDAATIGSKLALWKSNLKLDTKKKLIKTIVVDFSFALIHAICLGVLETDFIRYLESSLKNEIAIKICSSHLIKSWHNALCETSSPKSFIGALLDLFADVIEAETRELYVERCAKLYLILKSSHVSPQMANTIRKLCSKKHSLPLEDEEPFLGIELDESTSSKYKDVSIVIDIRNMVELIAIEMKRKASMRNPLFNEALAKRFLVRYCPFGKVISSFNAPRTTNATVESYFKTLKHSVLGGKTNLKPSRFLHKIR